MQLIRADEPDQQVQASVCHQGVDCTDSRTCDDDATRERSSSVRERLIAVIISYNHWLEIQIIVSNQIEHAAFL